MFDDPRYTPAHPVLVLATKAKQANDSLITVDGVTLDLDDELLDPRVKVGLRIKAAHNIRNFPRLTHWNYGACPFHDTPTVSCEYQLCGGEPWRVQKQGMMWAYVTKKGIIADEVGCGKTGIILGTIAMLKERDELIPRTASKSRQASGALVICTNPLAAEQWADECRRWTPGVEAACIYSGMDKDERIRKYMETGWDLLIMGHQMMLRDIKQLKQLNFQMVVSDDVDPIINEGTKTATEFKMLTRNTERVVLINATPLQTRLQQLYATSLPVGGLNIFGSLKSFEQRYVRFDRQTSYDEHTGAKSTRNVQVGYKNMDEFRRRMTPIYIRRTDEDLDDVNMPEVMPPQIHWLDMHPAQREKYDELQRGVLRLIKEAGGEEQVKHVQALAKVTYGAEVCAGLPALGEPDGPQASIKLDWLMDKLLSDWVERKVIVYSRFRGTIVALRDRLRAHDMDLALIIGHKGSTKKKAEIARAQKKKFWEDPKCKVCVGTSTMEKSHNLQVSNTVVYFDSLLNPARMHQILGRARRGGSRHTHVHPHFLFCNGSQEEKYMKVLRRRQALADFVWGDQNDLFEQLSVTELLDLIRP